MPTECDIRQATILDLEALASLFNAYRMFYNMPDDLALARKFLRDRFERSESICFMAWDKRSQAVGFTQLYPMFSSGAAARIFILNDLFVVEAARKRGIARALLSRAAEFAKDSGAVSLRLSTGVENKAARALYESQGWQLDTKFVSYNHKL